MLKRKDGTGAVSDREIAIRLVSRRPDVCRHFEKLLSTVRVMGVQPRVGNVPGVCAEPSLPRVTSDRQIILVERALFNLDFYSDRNTKAGRTGPCVVIIVDDPEPEFVQNALQRGVYGFLSEEASALELVSAVQSVQSGVAWIPHSSLLQVFENHDHESRDEVHQGEAIEPEVLQERLSSREQEVVRLVQVGLSDKEIARELGISFKTVKTHMHHIFEKLNIHSRVKLALIK